MHARHEPSSDQRNGINTGNTRVKDEEKKIFVIANSDAIVDPRTMI
jgi:hypothetical protein